MLRKSDDILNIDENKRISCVHKQKNVVLNILIPVEVLSILLLTLW